MNPIPGETLNPVVSTSLWNKIFYRDAYTPYFKILYNSSQFEMIGNISVRAYILNKFSMICTVLYLL